VNRIKYSSQHFMTLALAVISAGMVIKGLTWRFRSAIFPVVIGSCVFLICIAEFLTSVYGMGVKKEEAMDFKFSEDIDPVLAKRRTLIAFGWIVGFFFLILLFGFNIGIVLYVFLYIKVQRKEKWLVSIFMTVGAWFFFWGLFVWLLHTRLQDGLIFKALKAIGIR
jgi:hypothetical protein